MQYTWHPTHIWYVYMSQTVMSDLGMSYIQRGTVQDSHVASRRGMVVQMYGSSYAAKVGEEEVHFFLFWVYIPWYILGKRFCRSNRFCIGVYVETAACVYKASK